MHHCLNNDNPTFRLYNQYLIAQQWQGKLRQLITQFVLLRGCEV
jgi:hypothetical protein